MSELSDKPITLPRRGASRRPSRLTRVVAIDFDAQHVRVARAIRRSKGAKVTRLLAEPLPPADELDLSDAQAFGSWLGDLLKKRRLLKDPVVMCVPRGQVLLRSITLPAATPPDELPDMTRFQVGRDLPLGADEAVIDMVLQSHFAPGGAAGSAATGSGGSEGAGRIGGGESATERDSDPPAGAQTLDVLAVAVRKQTVDYYRQLAEAAGVKLAALGMRSYANARCMQACESMEPNQRVTLLHLQPNELLVDVLVGQQLLFSRAVRLPTLEPNSDQPKAQATDARREQIAAEAVRNLRSLQANLQAAHPTQSGDRVLITGNTGMESDLTALLGKRLGCVCQTLDVGESLKLAKAHREHASGSVAVLGLAIGAIDPEGLPFDFLHPRQAPPRRNTRRLIGIGAAAAVGLVLLTGYVVQQRMVGSRQAVLDDITSQIRQIERNERGYRQTLRDYDTLRNWQARREPWLDHLAWLSAVLPSSEELYITQLATAASGTMRVGVQARDPDILVQLEQKLRTVGYDLRPVAITPVNDRHGYPFRATLEMTPRGPLDVDLAEHQPPPRPDDDVSLTAGRRRR